MNVDLLMCFLKQVTKTAPLIPYEQCYIRSRYYKELSPEHNTGKSNPVY